MKTNIFEKALQFATKAHQGQFRKGTEIPYIVHPISVSQILRDAGCPQDWIMAGLLHDTVEDTDVELSEIEKCFGKTIATLVQGLSEHDTSDTWENRKQHTIHHLKTAPLAVVTIACADKLDNIRSMRKDFETLGEKTWDRFNRPKEKQRWYYTSMGSVFNERLIKNPGSLINQEFQKELKKVFL